MSTDFGFRCSESDRAHVMDSILARAAARYFWCEGCGRGFIEDGAGQAHVVTYTRTWPLRTTITACSLECLRIAAAQHAERLRSEEMTVRPSDCPEDSIAECERRRDLYRALITLTPREDKVIRLAFGLFGNDIHTLTEIAAITGYSAATVSQIKRKALSRLRHPSRTHLLLDVFEVPPSREGPPI